MILHKHFFIIGAQRSGTTYLYYTLDAHPGIQMAKPVRPEPKYFLHYDALRQGSSVYFNRFFNHDENVEWYGEKSTSYYENIDAGKRISAMFPEARIIIILRDPVDRAISNYLFSYKHGVEKRTMREVFIEKKTFELQNPQRFSTDPLAYIERGEYINYIKPYSELFPVQNFRILILEEFIDNEEQLKNLYHWFTVNPDFKPSLPAEKINAFEGDYPETDEDIIETLRKHYSIFNKELEKFTGKYLTAWK